MPNLAARRLTPNEITSLAQDKKDWILGVCPPIRIILSGSSAKMEMTEASDIDLIVVFKTLDDLNSAKRKLWSSRPSGDWPVDLVFHTTQSFQHSCDKGGGASWIACREGIVLFEEEALFEEETRFEEETLFEKESP